MNKRVVTASMLPLNILEDTESMAPERCQLRVVFAITVVVAGVRRQPE